MNTPASVDSHRIIVIDDNPAIHDDIRKILCPRSTASASLSDAKSRLFGDSPAEVRQNDFEIDSAFQGEEGLQKVAAASAEGRPYSMAFVDVRMPPGWDGIETISRIWKNHPDLQVVICTAYSDYSWEEMVGKIGRTASMVVLKKPFDNIEVLQLAHALTEKWKLNEQVQTQIRDLDQLVDRRTAELQNSNEQLKLEIAERLQVEKALVLSEERFSKAFRANPIPLAILSLQRECFSDLNPGFEALTGFSREALLGQKPRDVNLWEDPSQALLILEQIRKDRFLRHRHCRLRTREGAIRDILLSVELVELAGETSLLTVAQDITDQLLLENQLRHSQKMEAVGQLAAGIAHDFNNMLTVIQGNASLLLYDQPTTSPDRPMLDGILSAAQRSAKLVRQLLTFSHKQLMEVKPLDLTGLRHLLSDMLPRMLGEQVIVQVDLPTDLPPVSADAGMIEQMLMNLAVNARDAMPKGGRLVIGGQSVDFFPEVRRLNPDARPGKFLCLSVSDTGTGIPPEVLPRIFEPFYTTKPVGQGTGLGLATVYGIAKQHEGWIDVQSTIGQGTTFNIYLPYDDSPYALPESFPEEAITSTRGHECILVVEDEEIVRECVTHILKNNGYRVIIATNGVEALKVWDIHKDDIDLMLTDIVMPEGISGLELARRLVDVRPNLKVIFTSGYSQELSNKGTELPFAKQFIAKPYQASLLLQTIRQYLDQAAVTQQKRL